MPIPWKNRIPPTTEVVGFLREVILMNPPFEQLVDTEHVRHAYELLLPGGRLISVMSMSSFFNSYTKAKEFREWLETVGGAMEKLPEGSFVPSGTGVSACLVCIDK